MATTLTHFKLATILSITIILALTMHVHPAFGEDDEHPIEDQFLRLNVRSGSRFLADKVKKGAKCDPRTNNVCPAISAKNGTELLQCCKTHCRNIIDDRNNCGVCGHKCGFGRLCCGGKCTDIAYNVNHCGKCDKQCKTGVKCEYGVCGYA